MDALTERIRRHFDETGNAERDRLVATPRDRVSFELHRRLIAEHVNVGDRVLEIGAGPGRFTIELARLGASITVTDLSSVQLELNEQHVRAAGCSDAVVERQVLDVRDASTLVGTPFDVVVAFGGPLSYVFDDAHAALGGLVEAVSPGGRVLASVMAIVRSVRYFLPVARGEVRQYGRETYDRIMGTGDLRDIPATHTCRIFRWREIATMIAAHPCRLVAASASNCLSLGAPDSVASFEADAELWPWFLDWEARLCREPGALDAGTHILFALVRADERG